jgi:hypothetical protein
MRPDCLPELPNKNTLPIVHILVYRHSFVTCEVTSHPRPFHIRVQEASVGVIVSLHAVTIYLQSDKYSRLLA